MAKGKPPEDRPEAPPTPKPPTLETRHRVMYDYADECESLAAMQEEFVSRLKMGLIFHPNAEQWERNAIQVSESLKGIARGVRSRIETELKKLD